MRIQGQNQEDGFTLIEALVALMIMAIVGLMAWRGMDAMIRGRENIESRGKQDALYVQLVRQFERDCSEKVINTDFDLATFSIGEKNVWWLRHHHENNQHSWMIVGYGIGPAGLQRRTSRAFLLRSDVLLSWQSILRDPDLPASNMNTTLELAEITVQQAEAFVNKSSILSTNNEIHLDGINMRWIIQNTPFPITRSCLMGSSL